jgi:hypothetical protein
MFYGILIGVPPMVVGFAMAIIIHSYGIYKLQKEKTEN